MVGLLIVYILAFASIVQRTVFRLTNSMIPQGAAKSAGGGIRTHEGLRHRVSQIPGDPEGPPKLGTVRLRSRTVLPLRPGSRLACSFRQRLGYPRASAGVPSHSAEYYPFELGYVIGN